MSNRVTKLKKNLLSVTSVSYTHLDVYKRQELQALVRGKDMVVKFAKSQILRWLGHVERMLNGRLYTTRHNRGRPRMRWLDGVIEDGMGIRGW